MKSRLPCAWAHDLCGCPVSLASVVLVRTLHGVVQAGFKDPAHSSRQEPSPLTFAGVELAKSILSAALLARESRTARGTRYTPAEALPLHSHAPVEDANEEQEPGTRQQPPLPMKPLYIAFGSIAFLTILRHQLILFRRPYASQATLDVFDALPVLFVGLQTYLLLGTATPLRHWTSALLQIAAFVVVRNAITVPRYPAPTYILLLFTCTISSLVLVATSTIYNALRDVPLHKLNLVLSTSCFAGYMACAILSPAPHVWPVPQGAYPRDFVAAVAILALRALGDLLVLAVLRRTQSAWTVAAVNLLSASLVPACAHASFWSAVPFRAPQWLATALALYAGIAHLLDAPSLYSPALKSPTPWPARRGVMRLALVLVPLLAGLVLGRGGLRALPVRRDHAPFASNPHAPMPHQYPHLNSAYSCAGTNSTNSPATSCMRRPLPPSSFPTHPAFGAFEDVLLVVFFSHARYDINLDAYREVYSAYFPNILFIGPESREDRGFLHSYDVVVDSYMAAEDFNADWFKMSGRMVRTHRRHSFHPFCC